MSFHTSRHVKNTRKIKRCDWCRELIQKGEPSIISSGVFEGNFYSVRYHPECYDAVDRWIEVNRAWCEGLPMDPMNRGGIEPYGEEEK